jgi:hypothetical protein
MTGDGMALKRAEVHARDVRGAQARACLQRRTFGINEAALACCMRNKYLERCHERGTAPKVRNEPPSVAVRRLVPPRRVAASASGPAPRDSARDAASIPWGAKASTGEQ